LYLGFRKTRLRSIRNPLSRKPSSINITIRKIEEKDFAELIDLFREFALFEKLPDKMTNSVTQMKAEKEYLHGFVAVS